MKIEMKKTLAMFLSAALIVVIAVSSFFAYHGFSDSSGQSASGKPFYMGVTYCGNSPPKLTNSSTK